MRRFYVDIALQLDDEIVLPENVYHHWVRVLRASVCEHAILFNGKGGEYTIQLIAINKKSATGRIVSFNPDNRTSTKHITIGQVMSKGERMDYMVQKATELGVNTIQLLTSERCEERLKYERDQKKIQHWHNVAISACEQCGLNIVPHILPPVDMTTWVSTVQAELKLVMAPRLGHPKLTIKSNIAVLIGPEGGLSDAEIEWAQQQGFAVWQLGNRVLRTETAPIVALSILQFSV